MGDTINYNEKSSLLQVIKAIESETSVENLSKYLSGQTSVSADAPFLSVIMRTQGKRPEALSEILLCMCAQSDMDFEVLIMGHNLADEGRESVCTIIEELPSFMDGKVRLIEVNGGNRTTPLNEGFTAAGGQYISILDDDDLVLENWVEAFHTLSKENSGKILHTFCVSQEWTSVENEAGETTLVSVSPFRTIYCSEFDMASQLITNTCPTFSLAFPADAFKLLNIRFDESLTTTEDWDFLMRNATVCGVADAPVITGIYRMWVNAENSATVHNEEEWKKNYNYIQKKLNNKWTLMPPNALTTTIQNVHESKEATIFRPHEFNVYLDKGNGFDIMNPVKLKFSAENGVWSADSVNVAESSYVKRIRVSPISRGAVTLKGISVDAYDDNYNKLDCRIDTLRTNGIAVKDMWVFIGLDPHCEFKFDKPTKISRLKIDFNIEYDVPINFFRTMAIRFCVKKWFLAVLTRAKKIIKG